MGAGRVDDEHEVTDTGSGIPADRMDRLFRSFSQVDPSTTRTHGGTGLGLAISQRLVRAMGGRLEVHSTVSSGTTFAFELTLATTTANVRRTHPSTVDLSGRLALVVDDNHTNRQVLRHQLERWGMHCVDLEEPTVDRRDALRPAPLRILLANNPTNQKVAQLLLAELGHEAEAVADGRAAVQTAHRSSLTAGAFTEDRNACLNAGMNAYLTKPDRAPAEVEHRRGRGTRNDRGARADRGPHPGHGWERGRGFQRGRGPPRRIGPQLQADYPPVAEALRRQHPADVS